jgi:hypothetical protein
VKSDIPLFRPTLPLGWYYPDCNTALKLHAELLREVPPGHALIGREVETFAWRDGATDDVLFRHTGEPDRFTIIHLSWVGRTEINAEHPAVEFDGTFVEFLAEEKRLFGLTPPRMPKLDFNEAGPPSDVT